MSASETATCDVCGEEAEFLARPTIGAELPSAPPEDFDGVKLCAKCLSEGVPPGWAVGCMSDAMEN